jgi:hypothetical protein
MGPSRIVAQSILAAAALATPLFAAPVTLGQLEAMGRQKVDPAVMRAIVERDCVDFDVDAGNASELSKLLPAGVLEAAIECRKRAASTGPGAAAPTATPAPAPAAASASAPAANAPAASVEPAASSPGVPGDAGVRVRAIFIAESGALRCSCSLDGRPIAMLTKEAQGEFGRAVERSKVRRESGYVSTGAGRHVVAFVCDPGAQAVRADLDLVAGERRTIEIAESALRHWKLRKIDKN